MFSIVVAVGGAVAVVMFVLLICVGFRDRIYALPLVTVCSETVWQALFILRLYPQPEEIFPFPQWLLLVGPALLAVLIFQLLRYGPAQFPGWSRTRFYVVCAGATGVFAGGDLLILHAFRDQGGGMVGVAYVTMLDGLVVGIGWLTMLWGRRSSAGQSLLIAFLNVPNEVCPALAFWFFRPELSAAPLATSVVIPAMSITMIGCSLAYLVFLARVRQGEISHALWANHRLNAQEPSSPG